MLRVLRRAALVARDELTVGLRRRGLRPASLAVALALLAWAPVARGHPGVELRWDAPPECPGPEAVHREIAQLAVPETSLEPLRVDVAIRRNDAGWHANVELDTGERAEPREFDAESCDELVEAIAVVVSLVVTRRREALEVPRQEEPSPPEPPAAEPTPAALPTEPEPRGAVARAGERRLSASRPGGIVRVGVGAAVGYVLDTSVGVEFGAGIGVGSERLLLEFERWAGVHSEVERSGVGIVASRLGVGPAACYGGQDRLRAEVCGGVRAVLIDASSDDVAHPRTDQGWFPSAVLRVGAGWGIAARVRIGLGAQLQVPLRRVEFRFDPGGSVTALPPIGGAVIAELTWGK